LHNIKRSFLNMKKVLSILAICALFASVAVAQTKKATVTKAPVKAEAKIVEAKPTAPKGDGPTMTFETLEMDYGTIEQGADPYREFKFKNTGKSPLIITAAQGSCGCTVPEYPKEPIMAGEANVIKVRYDTNRPGKFTKTVTLTTNEGTDKRVLRIFGEVLKKEEPKSVPTSAPTIFGGSSSDH
jgi:hypothetical protein